MFIEQLLDTVKTYNFKKHMSDKELENFNRWLNQFGIESYSKKKQILEKIKEDFNFAASLFSLFIYGIDKPKTKIVKQLVGIYDYGDEYYFVFKFNKDYYKLEWTKNGFIFDKVVFDKIKQYVR